MIWGLRVSRRALSTRRIRATFTFLVFNAISSRSVQLARQKLRYGVWRAEISLGLSSPNSNIQQISQSEPLK